MPKKLTQAEFLAKAVAVHGSHYDYSQTVYLPMPQKVSINCPAHGVFMQKAGQHIAGKGCPGCGEVRRAASISAANQKWTTETFRARCKEIYPTLDFSASVYTLAQNERVSFACPTHGALAQVPFHLLSGKGGCRLCKLSTKNLARPNKSEWVRKFKAVHGEKYDYSNLPNYFIHTDKVAICCPQHGEFLQNASNHYNLANGCRKCKDDATSRRRSLSREQYVAMFRATHGERYDYTQVQGQFKAKDKVPVICRLHGTFRQTAFEHAHGQGCPACAREALNELTRLSWIERAAGRTCSLYFLRLYTESESFYKVGVTCQTVAVRYGSARSLAGYAYEILAQHTSSDAARIYDWEQSILQTFAHLRYTPAKPFDGATECFRSAEEILSIFPL